MRISEILRKLADRADDMGLDRKEPAGTNYTNSDRMVPVRDVIRSKRTTMEDDPSTGDIEPAADGKTAVISVAPDSNAADELTDILQLAGQRDRINTTIAQPSTAVIPTNPLMVPPLQQQIELQKQQGGKASPVINQILHHHGDNLPSTADQQPEQSIYHGIDAAS